ncbi:Rv0909 family putative TA system antitoxin [Arcanobacterium phocae]|uniref:MT0933-like antitoxin protein n=1 Tax=Arcanobacterium phocae TaxID=131112 RepID=A0A1H2LAZ4_9ACTO|nr:Rv0909 family putative TA system antitoxin [Arcanobacterium phocae]SDU77984.1 MT0933-like antitoxin protein [Arcanobacterium phocae]
MSLFDKAKETLENNKDVLKSDKAEEISDMVLDKTEEVAKKVAGEQHADKISQARDAIDSKIGNK